MPRSALTLANVSSADLRRMKAPKTVLLISEKTCPRIFAELVSLREGPAEARPRIRGGRFLPATHANRERRQSPDLAALIADSTLSSEDFVLASQSLAFPSDFFDPDLPRDIRTAIDTLWEHRHHITEYRRHRMALFAAFVAELEPLNQYLIDYQHPRLREATKGSSLPLIGLLLDAQQWPYRAFLRDFAFTGFDVLGVIPDYGLWTRRSEEDIAVDKSKRLRVSDLIRGDPSRGVLPNNQYVAKWSRILLQRYQQASDESHQDYVDGWTKTKEEIADGTTSIVDAATLDQLFGRGKWRACLSFILRQNGKIRIIDNHKHGDGNATVVLLEKLALAPADFPAAVAVAFARLAAEDDALCDAQCVMSADDERHAYRNMNSRHPEYTICLQVDTDTNAVQLCLRRGMSFGQRAAAGAYSTKPEFICSTLCVFFACPARPYIDDTTIAELEMAVGPPATSSEALAPFPLSGQGCLAFLATIIATPLNQKRVPPTTIGSACGTTTDLSQMLTTHRVFMGMTTKSIASARSRIAEVMIKNRLPRHIARKLAGKLQSVLIHVSAARGALQPLFDAAEFSSSGAQSLSEIVIAALEFLDAFLADACHLQRSVPLFAASLPPLVVFSDASYAKSSRIGFVAWVIFIPLPDGSRRVFYAYEQVPDETLSALRSLREQEAFIMALEEIALISVFFSAELEKFFHNRDFLCFADNQSANGATVKGYSSCPDIARLVNQFYLRLAQLSSSRVWIEYIDSARNFADIPTRLSDPVMQARWDSFLRSTDAVRLPFIIPPLFGWCG